MNTFSPQLIKVGLIRFNVSDQCGNCPFRGDFMAEQVFFPLALLSPTFLPMWSLLVAKKM